MNPPSIHDLPGADLVGRGLEDYAAGRTSAGSLLVAICRRRLIDSGLLTGSAPALNLSGRDPEHVLYELLCTGTGRNAWPEYRAMLRQLTSFNNAVDQRRRRLHRDSLLTP